MNIGGRKQKTSQNQPENQFFGPVLTYSLEQNEKFLKSDAFLSTALLVKISSPFGHIWRSKVPRTNLKQPKMVLSAGRQKMRVAMNGQVVAHPNNNQKCHEIYKIKTLTSPNNSLQNASKVGIFLLLFLTISL